MGIVKGLIKRLTKGPEREKKKKGYVARPRIPSGLVYSIISKYLRSRSLLKEAPPQVILDRLLHKYAVNVDRIIEIVNSVAKIRRKS